MVSIVRVPVGSIRPRRFGVWGRWTSKTGEGPQDFPSLVYAWHIVEVLVVLASPFVVCPECDTLLCPGQKSLPFSSRSPTR